ncbi:MAG: hypothetical protein PHG66_06455 [Candidatus Colwellbacteria bacterium]|nr:hypothetical protein [Candidatus Colwellbacteria bacterium]
MPKKTKVTTPKKTTAKIAKAPVKSTSKKAIKKGESLVCGICGLSVSIERIGDITVRKENVLLCCGKPMKTKVSKLKTKETKLIRK